MQRAVLKLRQSAEKALDLCENEVVALRVANAECVLWFCLRLFIHLFFFSTLFFFLFFFFSFFSCFFFFFFSG